MSVTVSCEEGGRYRQRDERERVAASGSVRSVAEPLKQRKDYLFSPLLATLRGGLGRSCSLVSLRVARAEGG